ncbi:iron complex transport system permease protein [Alkalibacterium subtropicum]|uniref:Iron complex transport system permease protein n=1 Tax=Alkalibacterium subtropicum TaxID=753702 RepID=A0A1I1HHZ2_9LACT|nr:iron ABC transporter permease [Alkalibacterium subtropicum]SFC23657.1 iron complex transport system permease protein [Alkalibacterium subtropicum]
MFSSNKESLVSYSAGFILLALIGMTHLTQGQAGYSLQQLLTEVWVEGRVQDIVVGLRLPRLVIGILTGGALASAGVILQTMTHNPLASASTLGINAGAFFAVVVSVIFFPGLLGNHPFIVAVFGAILSVLLVLSLSGRELEPVRVALTGMVVSLMFSSATGALQLLYENETSGLFLWGSGTLIQLDWSGVQFAFPFILVTLLAAILTGSELDAFSLGEELATSLGQSVGKVKLFSWVLAITLSAVTVSVVGAVGFIGLMAPHIVRLIGIKGHRALLTHSFLWGSVLLVAADVMARLIQPDQEIPVGAMTALIGGPWLMFLAYRTATAQKRGERSLGGTKRPLALKRLFPVLLLVLCIAMFISLSYNGTNWASISEWTSVIIWNFRIPRVLITFIIGAMMAASGVLLQGVLRNPLADASVLGITSMSGVGAMVLLVLFPGVSIIWMPAGAILGAMVAMLVIFLTTSKTGFQPMLVALIGISISAVGSALIQIFVVRARLVVSAALVWLSGSTYAKGWSDVYLALMLFLILVPVALYLTRSLNALAFGDDIAASHGLYITKVRAFSLITGAALSAAAVSIVGTIGFIGLLAPHIARRLIGYFHLPLMIVSMMIGGLLLNLADFLGRVLITPKEIPSGLVVTLIGAPYLLYLLRKIK